MAQGIQENLVGLAPELEALRYVKGLKLAGKGLLLVQVGVSTAQSIDAWKNSYHDWTTNNGNKWGVTGKAALDVAMAAVGAFGGPVGWVVSGGYFIGDAMGLWGNWGEAPKKP